MGSVRTAEATTSTALRALRRPQTGLAGVLAAIAPELDARMVAAYLVPAEAGPVEMLAAGGTDAGTLGPPGRVSERQSEQIRSISLESAIAGETSGLSGSMPWSKHEHVSGISSILSDEASCVLIAGGDSVIDPDVLYRSSASVGLLAQAIAQEREIARLQGEVRHMSQDRSLLASTLQHDLRSPLTSILGYASTLRNHSDRLPGEQKEELLDSIMCQARRLNRMITEAIARESGDVSGPLRVRLVQIDELVGRVAATGSSGRAGEVAVECAGAIEVVTDPDRLERALLNLVDNALKYSPPEIPAHVIVEDGPTTISFTVADNGPGVSSEVLPGLFGAFATDPGRTDGTGLGLHSAKQLAEELGGRISYSRTHGWSRFCITIPRKDDGT